MVDFQKRDTRRGLDGGGDGDDQSDVGGTSAPADATDDGQDAHHHHHDHGHAHDNQETGHGHHAHDVSTVGAAVVTVSSTRSLEDDPAGDAIVRAFEAAGDSVVTRELIADSYDGIQHTVSTLGGRADIDVVVTTGGTGVTPDDVTVEAVDPLFGKTLPGFGELFRLLSYDEIGTRVVGTRAVAGVADGVPVFCLPGSENAARLGTEEIIVEEAGHLAGLAHREEAEEGEE